MFAMPQGKGKERDSVLAPTFQDMTCELSRIQQNHSELSRIQQNHSVIKIG